MYPDPHEAHPKEASRGGELPAARSGGEEQGAQGSPLHCGQDHHGAARSSPEPAAGLHPAVDGHKEQGLPVPGASHAAGHTEVHSEGDGDWTVPLKKDHCPLRAAAAAK